MLDTGAEVAPDALPRTRAALSAGIERGLHGAAAAHVLVGGRVSSCAVGTTTGGAAATPDTVFPWTCASKPVLAIGLGTLVDAGSLDLDTPVVQWLPEATGLAGVTCSHLLTHTVGWRGDPGIIAANGTWDEAVAAALDPDAVDPGWVAGARAAYSVWTGWLVLAEIARRITGRPVEEWLADTVLTPSGAVGATFALAPTAFDALGDRVALLQHRPRGEVAPYLYDQRPWSSRCWPGLSARGTVADLAAVSAALLADTRGDGPAILTPATATRLVTPHRVGIVDESTGVDFAWGLGLTVDRRAVHPRASAGVFSHAGLGSSCLVFADPARDLVVAFATDGIPSGLGAAARRFAVVQAAHRDAAALR